MAKKTESEPEPFCELMYRFMSAAYRLRLAVNDIEHSECLHNLHAEHKPTIFVLQEATEDLEKIRKDFRAWKDTHGHTPNAKSNAGSDEQAATGSVRVGDPSAEACDLNVERPNTQEHGSAAVVARIHSEGYSTFNGEPTPAR